MGSATLFSRSKRRPSSNGRDGRLGQAGADGAGLEHARAPREDADRLLDRLAIGPPAMQVRTANFLETG